MTKQILYMVKGKFFLFDGLAYNPVFEDREGAIQFCDHLGLNYKNIVEVQSEESTGSKP